MTFEQWLRKVDAHIEDICGLSHRDLADWNYRDAYSDEVSPSEAAQAVLEEEGFPFE